MRINLFFVVLGLAVIAIGGGTYYALRPDQTAPSPRATEPTASQQRPFTVTATPISSTQINVLWNAPEGAAPAAYRVYENGIFVATTFEPSYVAIRLAPDTVYTFSVRSYHSLNDPSPIAESEVTVRTPAPGSTASTAPHTTSTPTPSTSSSAPSSTTATPAPTPAPTNPARTPVTHTVRIGEDGMIEPASLTIERGDTVQFTYIEAEDEIVLRFSPRTVNDVKLDHERTSQSRTFSTSGTYTYGDREAGTGTAMIIVR